MIIENSKVIRKYKCGYEVREEVWKYGVSDEGVAMKTCYTPNGDWVGDKKRAHFLCHKIGIKPEKIRPEDNVCSIGFCEKEQKWYGWSHRGICGFGIGSTVKIDDCAFVPSSKGEFRKAMELWYSDEMYRNLKLVAIENGLRISYDIIQDKTGKVFHNCHVEPWVTNGRGEWEAKTLEDARQMAIDYANGVS